MFQPIGKVGEIFRAVFAFVGPSTGMDVGVLLQFGAAEERFATMRTDVGPLLKMDETVHLEVALGCVHFRAGFAFEGANTDVVLAMAEQLGFADKTV